MAILKRKNLPSIRKKHKDQKIVYCDGAFDLVHVGHVLFFEDCKQYGDILVVGLGSDALIKKNKGKDRPILNEDAFDIPYRRKAAKKYGVKLVILPRSCPKEFEEISTSKIIEKIKNP